MRRTTKRKISPAAFERTRRRLLSLAIMTGALACVSRTAWAQTMDSSKLELTLRSARIWWDRMTSEPDPGEKGMRVILLGAPGSGKGSVGDLVRSAYGFPKISTGDLLRDAVQKKTPLGLQAASQMGKGGLVDDALVLALLRERLAGLDCRIGYILDGYPRNLSQAKDLESLDGGRREIVFLIDVREDVVARRIGSRRLCPGCEAIYNVITKKPAREGVCDGCGTSLVQRQDDRPELVPERLKTYHAKTEPLIAYYEAKGVLHRIDGNGTIEETFRPIRLVLDGVLRGTEDTQVRP